MRQALLLIGVAGLLYFFLPGSHSRTTAAKTAASDNAVKRAEYQRPVKLPKIGNRGVVDKRMQKWIEPVNLGSVKFEAAEKHIALGATTGARKTTLLAMLIEQSVRPVVFIAGDSSPFAIEAMRARGWPVWTADGKNGGLYVFEGTPHEASQIVTVLFKSGQNDTGLQRGMARGVFRDAFQSMDDQGIRRSWPALADALLNAPLPDGLPNKNFEAAKVAWLARIRELQAALGPALGNDYSVVDLVRSECGFAFDLNAFSDLELATAFGELAVRLTQHAADQTGRFWWMIDELGLFDAALLGQIVRTCRIRKVKFVGASQIISDFGKTLRGLVKTWFVGEQTAADNESRKWCSDLTMGYVPPENFAEHATPPGFYYLVADGRTQDIQVQPWHHPAPRPFVRLLQPRPGRPGFIGPLPTAVTPYQSSQNGEVTVPSDTVDDDSEEEQGTITIRRPEVPVAGPPSMPDYWGLDEQTLNIWERHSFPDGLTGCHESTYRLNNRGRPMCTYKGDPEAPSQQWLVYALALALRDAEQMGLDEEDRIGYLRLVRMLMASRTLTVEHHCENKRCTRTEHTSWLDRGNNSRAYFERLREAKRSKVAA